MPALYRTVLPRVRKSLEAHGLLGTLRRAFDAPFRLLREQRSASILYAPRLADAFDLTHNVETSQRIHQSDLRIDSPNWTYGTGYWPSPEEIVRETLAALPIQHKDFTFVDLGSGKGRVLLMASDYPFERIIGVEYAPELHDAAVRNLQSYSSESQLCRALEARRGDISQFVFPETPMVVFLYNPATEPVMRQVADNLFASLERQAREVHVIYVTPTYGVFERDPLRRVQAHDKYAIYSNCRLLTPSGLAARGGQPRAAVPT
jgi:hypothetical protein